MQVEADWPVGIGGQSTKSIGESITFIEAWIARREQVVAALKNHRSAGIEAEAACAEVEQ